MGSRVAGTTPAVGATDSRRDILDAAARLLRQHGYKSTTVRDIAGAVGIKAASIYYHFASKDELVAAVMNEGVDHVVSAVQHALDKLPPQATPPARIEVAIRAHLEALLSFGDYTSAGLKAYSEAPEVVRSIARPHRRRYEALWSDLIQSLVQTGQAPKGVSPETLTLAAFGMMNWSPEWYRPRRHSLDAISRDFASIIVGSAALSGAPDAPKRRRQPKAPHPKPTGLRGRSNRP